MSDKELEQLRDQLYSLADIAIECELHNRRQKKKRRTGAEGSVNDLRECA